MPSKADWKDPDDGYSHEFEVPAYFCVEFDSGQDNFESSERMKVLALQAQIDCIHAKKLKMDFIVECQWDSRLMIVIQPDDETFQDLPLEDEADYIPPIKPEPADRDVTCVIFEVSPNNIWAIYTYVDGEMTHAEWLYWPEEVRQYCRKQLAWYCPMPGDEEKDEWMLLF